MTTAALQEVVLSENLADLIAGRRVRTAVFTTFSFDPGFFELNVLPMLFDQTFSQIDKVRRIQLEEAIRSVREIAVYYDRRALAQDALPAQLDFARIDVSRGKNKGYFHPKLVMLLVDEPDPEDPQIKSSGYESLIVGALSANLTCAGWWENLETGHFEEVKDKKLTDDPCPFRSDLLQLIRHIKNTAAAEEDHAALDQIHQFVRQRVSTRTPPRHSHAGEHYTRVFLGQERFDAWLAGLRVGTDWNFEIVSPYFDPREATVVANLIENLGPRETRIYLPRDADGQALVTKDYHDAVSEYAYWADLPESWTSKAGGGKQEKRVPRRVHAKIYRLWHSTGKQIVIVGSINLTTAAQSNAKAGNLEAAFLVDETYGDITRRWWLRPVDSSPQRFLEESVEEEEVTESVCIDISLRYDWSSNTFEYRVDDEAGGRLMLRTLARKEICSFEARAVSQWVALPETAADQVRELLASTSLLEVVHAKGMWRVLIRETGMSHRPSIISNLTPEEILLYWSLLSPAQKEAFIAKKLAAIEDLDLEGIRVTASHHSLAQDTIFDRFAGIYHAFERLQQHVVGCLENGEYREAQARLFGAKYDSLPELLRKTEEENEDPILQYIVFLCGQQVMDAIGKQFPEFWRGSRDIRRNLSQRLSKIPDIETRLPLDGSERPAFITWYRKMFLQRVEQPVEVA